VGTLRYHAGRMVLFENEDGWSVRIKAKDTTITTVLSSVSLSDAILEAEVLYHDARAVYAGASLCFQCVHWEPGPGECGLEFPEGRQTGGRYAAKCPAFFNSQNRRRR
jgi:hypothetical protein